MLSRDERLLLAAVHRWARQNGWYYFERYARSPQGFCLDWRSFTYADGSADLVIWKIGSSDGGEVRVRSVSQAVDVLVALGVLPVEFNAEVQRLRAEVAAEIAEKIRAELVCCPTLDEAENGEPKHPICYWGELSARIAEAAVDPNLFPVTGFVPYAKREG